jgi:hypothetical protein
MKRAVMAVLPASRPGLTVAELRAAILPHLSEDLFPGGAKAGWWLKAVQLDLEAKGAINGCRPSHCGSTGFRFEPVPDVRAADHMAMRGRPVAIATTCASMNMR